MEQQDPPAPQSGKSVAFGVVAFMVGLVVILILLKYLLNL
jgi:hypothetical protein